MKRLVLFFVSLTLSACTACVEQDQLVKLECIPGAKQVCDHHGNVHESLNPDNAPNLPGQCAYGFRTCTAAGWGLCKGAIGPSEEICDGIDNDCNGEIDDLPIQECQNECGPGDLICVDGGQWVLTISDVGPTS